MGERRGTKAIMRRQWLASVGFAHLPSKTNNEATIGMPTHSAAFLSMSKYITKKGFSTHSEANPN
jgi:hypothetical protein